MSVHRHRLWQRSVPGRVAGDILLLLFQCSPLIYIGMLLTLLCIFPALFTAMQETQSMANWESESTGSALLIWELIFRHVPEPLKSYDLTAFYCCWNRWILTSLISHQLNDRLSILWFEKCHNSKWNNNKSKFLFSHRWWFACCLCSEIIDSFSTLQVLLPSWQNKRVDAITESKQEP